MKRYVILLTILSFVRLSHCAVVDIDLSNTFGQIDHCAGGFVGNFNHNVPGPDFVEPTKLKLVRGGIDAGYFHDIYGAGTAQATRSYIDNIGADIQVILGFPWWYHSLGGPDYGTWPVPSQKWPGDNNNWNDWDNYVQYQLDHARINGLNVQWDMWNEADDSGFWNPSGDKYQRFKDMWYHTFNYIKNYDTIHGTNSIIVGPSNSSFGYGNASGVPKKLFTVTDFLSWASSNNVLPDIINWHDWHPDDVRNHTPTIKSLYPNTSVSINEYVLITEQHLSGRLVDYYSAFEKEKVAYAAHTCWSDPDTSHWSCNNCANLSLNGLLKEIYSEADCGGDGIGDSYQTRSTWWTAKSYGDMSGDIASFSSSDCSVVGIASIDYSKDKAFILLGRDGGSGSVQINLSGLDFTENIHVLGQKIPNNGTNTLSSPTTEIDTHYTISNGLLFLTIPIFEDQQAYIITVSAGAFIDSLNISSQTLIAFDYPTYNITLQTSDLAGPNSIKDVRALINYQGDNSIYPRGYFVWGQTQDDVMFYDYDPDITVYGTAENGGFWGFHESLYGGLEYITPLSCETSISGNQRTITWEFKVKPQWGLDGPLTNNDISGYARNDSFTNRETWKNFDINFDIREPQCGDEGFLLPDFNKDCTVDMLDFVYFAKKWLINVD